VKRTLKRRSKVLETVKRETNGTSNCTRATLPVCGEGREVTEANATESSVGSRRPVHFVRALVNVGSEGRIKAYGRWASCLLVEASGRYSRSSHVRPARGRKRALLRGICFDPGVWGRRICEQCASCGILARADHLRVGDVDEMVSFAQSAGRGEQEETSKAR
jgi:hypothetical protein